MNKHFPDTQPFVGIAAWRWWGAPKGAGLIFAAGRFALFYWERRVLYPMQNDYRRCAQRALH
jgi:hypothetical protein